MNTHDLLTLGNSSTLVCKDILLRDLFFPLIVFPSAGFTPWPKDSHERGKGNGKGRVKEGKRKNRKGTGKGQERERRGKNRAVSHTDRFWCQKLSFSFSFCYRSWILCTFLFSGNGCNHQKRTVATTYQAPSLCRGSDTHSLARHYDNKQWNEETKTTI